MTISVNSNLGVSPVTSLPYAVSQASGLPLSTCVMTIYSFYVLLQILILRKEFKWVNLAQVLFSIIFGYLVDFCKWMLGGFCPPAYLGRLLMLPVGIFLVALGVTLYVEVRLVPMSMEGLTLALAGKLKKPFSSVKVLLDCLSVLAAVTISLLFLHRLAGVREGTVIAAIVTGRVVALIKRPLLPVLRRICFGEDAPAGERY